MAANITWTFGELEGVLSSIHAIDQTKRTAFQSRLKNFHRLGYPLGFKAVKGKAATYTPLQILDVALAVEMTQLGLPPERATMVLASNRWPILMATEIVARELKKDPTAFSHADGLSKRALSMFLYFDPAALHSLTLHLPTETLPDLDEAANSFFYGGEGIVREGITRATSGTSARISLINLTSLAGTVISNPYAEGSGLDLDYRHHFLERLEQGAIRARNDWEGGEEAEAEYVFALLERETISDPAALSKRASISLAKAADYIDQFAQQLRGLLQ